MFRFNDRARKVMALAGRQAQRFGHQFIGTEHILLALIEEGTGLGAHVMLNLDVDLSALRDNIEKRLQPASKSLRVKGSQPQTSDAKKAVEWANEESRNLKHSYIGTEHLLLGLLHDAGGIAGTVLSSAGLKLDEVREELRYMLRGGKPSLNPDAQRLLDAAVQLADEQNAAEVTPEHFILATLAQPGTRAERALARLGVTSDRVRQALDELP